MTELYFELTFNADQQRRYIKHFFPVPARTARIEIEYDYPRFTEKVNDGGVEISETNIVDLGLYDHLGNLRGWSGSDKTHMFTSETAATPGYRYGPVEAGEWAAALGLYKITREVTVRLWVRLFPKERKLLRGDLHMHTINSDGVYTTAEVIDFCRGMGLDFIALTDHNNTVQNSEIGTPEGITVIPGMEYTNYRGHANFYFPGCRTDFFEPRLLSNSFEEMKQIFLGAKKKDAVISLNHIDCDNCFWDFGYDDFPFDMVEVWNGPMKDSEMRAIARWQDWLCGGRKIPAVGGSDTHRHELSRTYGFPSTFVYADSNSIEDIHNALVRGSSFVSMSPEGPRLDFEIGGKILGETVRWEPGLEGRVEIAGTDAGDILRLINGKNEIREWDIPFKGVYRNSFTVERAGFYRVELYRKILGRTMLICLGNPIFIEG